MGFLTQVERAVRVSINRVYGYRSRYRRRSIRRSADPRPSSYPFISGDSFRKLADHIYDETTACFEPDAVHSGDTIFVSGPKVHYFFEHVARSIIQPFILITHNGDQSIGTEFVQYIDDRLIHWFAQNVCVTHPKITPIPIGLENLYYASHGMIDDFQRLRLHETSKKDKILFGFTIATNPAERQPPYAILKRHAFADELQYVHSRRYRQVLNTYKFVASPPGNGIDCHRTWEAIYLHVVPIVKASVMTHAFANYPIWIVDDWHELSKYDDKQLNWKYAMIMNRTFDQKKLWMDYYIELIRQNAKPWRTKSIT